MRRRRALCLALAVLAGCPGATPSTPLQAQQDLSGALGGYALRVPNGSWGRSDPAPLNDPVADLFLVRSGDSGWILVRRHSGANLRVESLVYARRQALLAAGASSYHERRYFLGRGDHVPASMARYVNGSNVILVLTAVRDSLGLELIGFTARASGAEAEILQVMESLSLGAAATP